MENCLRFLSTNISQGNAASVSGVVGYLIITFPEKVLNIR